jgi:hypothetical protein
VSRFLSLLLVLSLAAPAWAQPDRSSYVSAVAAARGDLLARNDHESVARFTQCVLAALPEAWDFLSKSAGENGYTWPNGVRTSHDVIVHRATGRQVDVVANSASADGTPARATWIPIDPAVYRPSNRPVAPACVPTALCAVPARPAESAANCWLEVNQYSTNRPRAPDLDAAAPPCRSATARTVISTTQSP